MPSLPCRSTACVAAIVMALSVSAGLPSVLCADETIVVGNQAQVLADDQVIESQRGLTRRINRLAKHPANPVIRPERFVLEGTQLRLNCDAKRGDIKVEVQDADGKPIPGFIAGLTNRINSDSVRQEVSWRGKGDFASLKGRTVKLRFQLHYARLYSLEVLP